MIKRITRQKTSLAAARTESGDSRVVRDTFGANGAPDEVAADDLNDLFEAAISRLADWVVQPPAGSGVMLACVEALRQLHRTAANELLRRQQQLDGQA